MSMSALRSLIGRLIAAAREHENDPFNDTHADRVDAILSAINSRYGFSMVVQAIAACERILQRAFHPLPEWCLPTEGSSAGSAFPAAGAVTPGG